MFRRGFSARLSMKLFSYCASGCRSYSGIQRSILESQINPVILDKIRDKYVVIFDGYCVFCNKTTKLLMLLDKNNRLMYAASNSEPAKILATIASPDITIDNFDCMLNNSILGNKNCNNLGNLFN
jgi:hypothetical protein